MAETIKTLYTEEQVLARINELADQINRDYEGKNLHVVCTLKGAVFFACELMKRLTVPVTMDFCKCSSYGSGTVSSGNVNLEDDLSEDIEDRHVLVIEDIVDTGRTLSFMMDLLSQRNPASLKLCTLLDKPSRRVVSPLTVHYNGFTIDDLFVVGYGLDYDQRYRNLPYIGVLEFN